MFRLVVAIVLAVLAGLAGGYGQYRLSYSDVSENLAEFRAAAAVAADSESSAAPVAVPVPSGSPKVEVVGGANHDFGTMQQGSTKSHSFVFRNIGTAPLSLTVEGSTCRCTIGSLEDSSLDPGEETKVTLKWEARGVLDSFSQTATIGTNDPAHERLLLSVKGIVLRTIMIEPPTLNLGDVSVTSDYKSSIHVFSYAEEPFQLTDVKWADEKSADKVKLTKTELQVDSARFPTHAKATGAARIDVEVSPGLPLGQIDTRILFQTSIKTVPSLEFSVSGKVVGDVHIMGSSSFDPNSNTLNLGTVSRKTGLSSRLFLSVQGPNRKDIKVELDRVVPKETMIVTLDEPKEQPNRILYPVTITIPENAPPAMYPGTNPSNFGKIYFKTSHPNIPAVPVHVKLIVE